MNCKVSKIESPTYRLEAELTKKEAFVFRRLVGMFNGENNGDLTSLCLNIKYALNRAGLTHDVVAEQTSCSQAGVTAAKFKINYYD